MNRKIYAFLGALAVLTGLACGTGTTTTGGDEPTVGVSAAPAPSPKLYKLGEKVTVKEDFLGDTSEYTVAVTSAKTFAKEPGSWGSKPTKGEFLVLDVAVAVVKTDDTVFVLSTDFKLVAPDGEIYDGAYASGFGDALSADELRTGQKSSGKLIFDLPKGAWKVATLQYAASFMDGDATCLWKLA